MRDEELRRIRWPNDPWARPPRHRGHREDDALINPRLLPVLRSEDAAVDRFRTKDGFPIPAPWQDEWSKGVDNLTNSGTSSWSLVAFGRTRAVSSVRKRRDSTSKHLHRAVPDSASACASCICAPGRGPVTSGKTRSVSAAIRPNRHPNADRRDKDDHESRTR